MQNPINGTLASYGPHSQQPVVVIDASENNPDARHAPGWRPVVRVIALADSPVVYSTSGMPLAERSYKGDMFYASPSDLTDDLTASRYTPEDGLDADERDPDFGGPEWYIGAQVRTKECSLGYADTWTPSPDGPVRGCTYAICTIIDLLGESKAKVLVLDGEHVGGVHTVHFDLLAEDHTVPNSSTVG